MPRRQFFYQLLFGGRTWEGIGLFVIGVILLGVVSNLLYDCLKLECPSSNGIAGVILGTAVLLALAVFLFLLWEKPVSMHPAERAAPKKSGLIWILSPKGLAGQGHLLAAARHHNPGAGERDPLHLWLIENMEGQNREAIRKAHSELEMELERNGWNVEVHRVEVENSTAEATFDVVEQIITEEAPGVGLRPRELAADITSGFKPMSMGMSLSAMNHGVMIEYVESKRTPEGEPDLASGELRVVEVGIGFSSNPKRKGAGDADKRTG